MRHGDVWSSGLGTAEIEYWKNTSVNPYQVEEADLNFAIDKLIEHGRPNEAISCLSAMLNEKRLWIRIARRKLFLRQYHLLHPVGHWMRTKPSK